MKISIGISPCPNDTYIFDALINNKIDNNGYIFEIYYEDVEKLNKWSFKNKLDFTKLSYNAYIKNYKDYVLIDSGSALGYGCGPIVIKLPNKKINHESLIAIPGVYTTANMLFNLAFPTHKNKKEFCFDQIENCILSGEVDAGVVIHESRFTFKQNGLSQVLDLGEFWYKKTNLPIPLGGVFAKRSLPTEVICDVEKLIRKSIEYANQNTKIPNKYILSHASETDLDVINSHINLYVNDFSISLGDIGRKSVEKLFNEFNIFNKEIFFE